MPLKDIYPGAEFTTEDVVREVRRIAAERPDFVYKKPGVRRLCQYVDWEADDAQPSCLIGHALFALGASPHLVVEESWADSTDLLPADDWLTRVQFLQDTGRSWGEAVAAADAGEGAP